jgi:excisionase family DNA binding protein
MPSTPGRSNKLSAYISIADAATYLGLTTRTVRQMIADGRLRGYRSGSRIVRLRIDEIDADMQPIGGGGNAA